MTRQKKNGDGLLLANYFRYSRLVALILDSIKIGYMFSIRFANILSYHQDHHLNILCTYININVVVKKIMLSIEQVLILINISFI